MGRLGDNIMVVRLLLAFVVLGLLMSCGGGAVEPVVPKTSIALKKGVIFNHTSHTTYSCESCHQCGIGSGKISFMGKDWAHITCKSCHSEVQLGPVSCKGCHVVPAVSVKAVAAATVLVTQTDVAVFVVSGTGMDGLAGIQMEITYDAAVLATPTITGGSLIAGALLAVNASTPGIVRIAAISTRPFTGDGQIAVISFASKAGSEGLVSIRTIETINTTGERQPVAVTVTGLNGTVPFPPIEYTPPFSEVPLYQIPSSTTIPALSFSCN